MSEKENVSEELVEETPLEETSVEEVEETVSEIDELKKQLEETEDKFLRARAEIANITNRNRNERELLQKYRSQDLGKKLLPAIDNLERALSAEVTDESDSLKKGIEMVLESLIHSLKEEGIEEIPAAGETFDPNLHQAVQTVPASDEHATDTIVEVLQKGYKLHDRILRPSMVVVAQ
ncbi:nucleotide exchange factor GrpE [Enterococcus saccharolyticus]|uniref:Protein GrpE n=1 Tax=Candidatus Enterococcus willemsii TaxID=1857215 RepID=A0ABQ6YXY9_9ENTE|nr:MULTISPECIES: nucleotide exchange factor GrpE [Enterococcus]KAF1302881.1 nucleotide exchange factor GrpE [Enterococcus sp. CU12B]MCD5000969.1 nucleotide exchange factor GrpE [Enterococcus saccharolyticus]